MTENTNDRLLLPPYRCCGVSTRKIKNRYSPQNYKFSYWCDICAWSYRPDGFGGWRRTQPNQHMHNRKLPSEVD